MLVVGAVVIFMLWEEHAHTTKGLWGYREIFKRLSGSVSFYAVCVPERTDFAVDYCLVEGSTPRLVC